MRPVKRGRVRDEGVLMMGPSATTYSVANMVGVNQSTVWRDVSIHLKDVDGELWARVQVVLKNNRRNVKKETMDNIRTPRYNRSVNP